MASPAMLITYEMHKCYVIPCLQFLSLLTCPMTNSAIAALVTQTVPGFHSDNLA